MARTFSARRGVAGALAVVAVGAGVTWSSSGLAEALRVAAVALLAVLLMTAIIAYGQREVHKP